MVRRLARSAPAVALVAAVSACGGSSGGLVSISATDGGIALHCGDTAHWEAAVIANSADKPATITSVQVDGLGDGFTLRWARAYRGSESYISESNAKTPVLGLRIAPAGSSLHDADRPRVGWHIVVGLRARPCSVPSGFRRGDAPPQRDYTSDGEGLILRYRVGDEARTFRVGARTSICAVPRGFACEPG